MFDNVLAKNEKIIEKYWYVLSNEESMNLFISLQPSTFIVSASRRAWKMQTSSCFNDVWLH